MISIKNQINVTRIGTSPSSIGHPYPPSAGARRAPHGRADERHETPAARTNCAVLLRPAGREFSFFYVPLRIHLHPNRVHLRPQELVTSLLPAPLRSTHLLKHICQLTPGLQTLSRNVSADAELHINVSTKPAVPHKIRPCIRNFS